MESYVVYVIRNERSARLYKGMTTNINRRLDEHNGGRVKSTRPFRPWVLIYQEVYNDVKQARRREKYFKTAAGRRFIKSIITKCDGSMDTRPNVPFGTGGE